jgi:hypothetical protein
MTSVKRSAWFAFGFALAVVHAAVAAEPRSGLAELTWGDAPTADMELTGRVAIEKPSRTAFYTPKTSAALGDVKVRSTELAFEDGRLTAAFLGVGSPAAVWADSTALDALWGPHVAGPRGFATWRTERTVAVLVEPKATGGRGPVVALVEAPASDERIAAIVRTFARRTIARAVRYDTNAQLPRLKDQRLNDQFRQELQPQVRSNPPQK